MIKLLCTFIFLTALQAYSQNIEEYKKHMPECLHKISTVEAVALLEKDIVNLKEKDGIFCASYYIYQQVFISMKNGKKDGVVLFYDSRDKNLQTLITYANGMKNGISIEFYDSGSIKEEANYKDNILNGEYKTFSNNGNIEDFIIYQNGIKLSEKKFNIDKGIIKNEIIYSNNGSNWIEIWYHPNGSILSKIEYKNKKIDGLALWQSVDGYKIRESNFKNGLKNGREIIYDIKGNIKASVLFKDNTAVSGKCANKRQMTKKDLYDITNLIYDNICKG